MSAGRRPWRAGWALVGWALMGPVPGSAQPVDDASTTRVYARRDAPISPAQVIDRETIADSGALDAGALLDDQASADTANFGGPGAYAEVSIRGSTGEQVVVTLDGIPLNAALGGAVDLSRLPLGQVVEQIEIYPGVAPFELDQSGIGGVVAYTTRAAPAAVEGARWAGGAELGYGSFTTRSASAHLGRSVGDDEGAHRWALSVDYLGTEGDFTFVDDQGTLLTERDDDVLATRQNNASDRATVVGQSEMRWGTRRLKLIGLGQWRRAGLPGLGVNQTREARFSGLFGLAGLRFVSPLPAGLKLIVAPSATISRSQLEDPLAEVGLAPSSTEDDTWAGELKATLSRPFLLSDELLLLTDALLRLRATGYTPGGEWPSSAALPTRRDQLSAGAQLGLEHLGWGTRVLGSARWLGAESRAEAGGEVAASASRTDARTAHARVTQRLPGGLDAAASIARAVRLPNLFELFGDTGFVHGSPELRPERATLIDGGLSYASAQRLTPFAARVDLRLYRSEVDDLIQFTRNAQGILVAENIDAARIEGVELSADLAWADHLRLRLSWAGMDAVNTGDIRARRGKRLPNRPRQTAYGRVDGGLMALGARWRLYGQVNYEDGNYLDHPNLVRVPERLRFGAGMAVALLDERLSVRLDVANLTDARVQDVSGYPTPGRHAFLTLRWQPDSAEGSHAP